MIMMNDTKVNVNCSVVCYANNTTLVNSDGCLNRPRLKVAMAQSLDQASTWFQANSFFLNTVSRTVYVWNCCGPKSIYTNWF